MNSERIKELQEQTAYPESRSVHQALLQVWNECQQENNKDIEALKNRNRILEKINLKHQNTLGLENTIMDLDDITQAGI